MCTTFNARMPSAINAKLTDYLQFLARHFPASRTGDVEKLDYSGLRSFSMLIDVHNSDVSKSYGEGKVRIKVGEPQAIVNQVTAKRRVFFPCMTGWFMS